MLQFCTLLILTTMQISPAFGAWMVGTVSSLLGYSQFPLDVLPEFNISTELGDRLSPNAAIFLPADSGWANSTRRWNAFSAPKYSALVEVSTERDIQETVMLPFEGHLQLGLL
jgi:hypothetical protein